MIARGLIVILLAAATLHANSSLVIIAPAAPGGGWDQTARVLQRVLAEIEPATSVQVDNIPGAAGTIGLARFIQSERGNPDALLVTGLVMVSGVITNQSPVSLADATPIARLTGETEVIVVPAASPFRTIRELVGAFQKDPGSVSWGGGSAGGTDDLLIRLLAEQVGLAASRVNYIAFAGGGAALAAVLGGQVTAAVSGYGEFAGQIAAGQLRPLAISAATRISTIDAPTLRESGIPLDLANWRAIVAPPGLSDAERDALIARITRLAESSAWKNAVARNGWDDLFLSGPDFRQFLLAEQNRVESVLQRLALADTASPARQQVFLGPAVTPTTIPNLTVSIFAIVGLALVITRWKGRVPMSPAAPGRAMAATLALALVAQAVLIGIVGFIVSSTITFAIAATAIRGRTPQGRVVVKDGLIGLVFAAVIFVIFSRGLGVSLP